MLSPVNADSFTDDSPSITIPSTGIFSPGFTMKISSFFTSLIGITISFPSRMTVAFSGFNFIRFFIAFVVFTFEMDSSIFPTVMRVTIIAAPSK